MTVLDGVVDTGTVIEPVRVPDGAGARVLVPETVVSIEFDAD